MEYINKLLQRTAANPARTSSSPTPVYFPCNTTSYSGNDSLLQKTTAAEHEVKVRFAREFADVGSITYSAPESSLSSASSFQSLSSTLSTKSSNGICPDSLPVSPNEIWNKSYTNTTIPGVEDLILGCAEIQIRSEEDQSFETLQNTQDLSQDQTFASATDEPIAELTRDLIDDVSPLDCPEIVEAIDVSTSRSCSPISGTQDYQDRPIFITPVIQTEEPIERSVSPSTASDLIDSVQTCTSDYVDELPLPHCSTEEANLNSTVCLSSVKESPDAPSVDEQIVIENTHQVQVDPVTVNIVSFSAVDFVNSVSVSTEHAEDISLPSISTLPSLHLTDSTRLSESDAHEAGNEHSPLVRSSSPVNDSESATELPENLPKSLKQETEDVVNSKVDIPEVNVSPSVEKEVENTESNEHLDDKSADVLEKTDAIESVDEKEDEIEKETPEDKLDRTLTFESVSLDSETALDAEQYTEFKPQRQSTTLVLPTDIEQPNFDELQSAAEEIANDIWNSSLEFPEESDRFISATSEIFQDPTCFDFLSCQGNSKTINRLRADSLYVKFDPLVGDTSMLPQGNTDTINEEQNGKTESPPPNIVTPKRNPAIAAIDRLLFYSPISTSMTQKMDEPREKIEQSAEEPKSDTPLINDVNLSKELELVRATVLQLEDELEKQKKEHKAELERQKNSFQEKINQLQAQIAQEVKSKSQMTVVVEEYEKSISRLLTEKERDRTSFEQEKTKIQDELQATNVHLSNTEAAFNDVHQKYEKVKGVVSVYKNNEIVLRESIQENMETIKCLQTRYDNLKNHATAQLEKANSDLEVIRKQHEDEVVKLHAMVRKAELKSNSLAELVEQKTKENKELTQILDEVIARVGHQNTE
ncbi:Transforming acidic coiled-coil-containing protein 1 [Dufourea novaeangliae]|uniref:Transforming acidic coiled-coil-containing protein 1 n=1 Tax=Dufourea novaeangliae TaxID=178035 RepID=A0A154PKC5_DUFNO|nr:Transforming acidic coiled-coil-containing protein 1 [Dufourea novaeangliae]